MMNRAMNKQQQQQQQQQQIRASKTMPQLNYTQADIQEQYLATTQVRHEARALAEQQQQQQASRRSAAAASGQSNCELRQSVKLKRSQQLAKFDDGGQSRHGSSSSQQQQSPLRGDSPPQLGGGNLRDSRPARGSNLDSKQRRSHSASRLLSACFSIPSQLANTIQNHHQHHQASGSPSSSNSKSRASSILSHFKLGGGGGATQYKNRRRTSGGGEYQDREDQDESRSRPQMRPLSNSRTLGNMQHLHNNNSQESNNQQDTDSLDSNQPGGSRMKHVSFGGGGGGHQNYSKQQPARQADDAARPTTQINVINKPRTAAAAAAGATTAICRQPTSTGITQVSPPRQRNQAAPPRPPAISAGGINPQGPIYKRLPNVPMRTQATQTEITAYHLMASPAPSSAPTPSRMGAALPMTTARGGGHQQLDTPSQRSTPTNSSTLATTELVSSSAGRADQSAAVVATTRATREQEVELDRSYGPRELIEADVDANADRDEEDDLERVGDGGLNASLLESSSSNGSSTHSLVGHDSALADTLQCDLRIGSQPAAVPTTSPASSGKTSITGKRREFVGAPQAPNPIQQEDEIPAIGGPASARGANMHELASGQDPLIVGGERATPGGRGEIEPPNRFKDSEQQLAASAASSSDDEPEPPSLVSEASSQTDASLMANAHILDTIDRQLASGRQQQPPRAAGACEAPISSPRPMAGEVIVDDDHDADDATPRPTPSHERADTEGNESPRRHQLCERLNDSDETSGMSTFDIGGAPLESAIANDDRRRRQQQPTQAELRRDDFLALRAAGEEESSRGNEYGDELASQTPTTSSTTGPTNAPAASAGAALLSATLEDVEPISLSPTASVSTEDGDDNDGPPSTSLQAQLSTGRDDDDDGRLVAQRLELIEDRRQFQIAVSRAPAEEPARVRPRQSSTSTLSTRHHSYCSTSAAAAGADFSNSPPSSSSSPPPDFYNRLLDSDPDDHDNSDGDGHAAYRDPPPLAAPASNDDHDQPVEQVADRGPSSSSSSSSSASSSSRRTLKSRRESETAAPTTRAGRDEPERGEGEKETSEGAKRVSSSTSSSSSSSSSSVSQAANGRDKSETTGGRAEQLPAANDPNVSSSSCLPASEGQDRSRQRPLADDEEAQPNTQDALQQADSGKPAGQLGHNSGSVECAIEPSNREEERAAQIEPELPARRTSSPPSPPTTVSDLDASEELSTASFVDNYKRSLKAQVGELADSFASGLIGECLTAATATETSRANLPSGSKEAQKEQNEARSSSSSSSSSSPSSATTTTSIGGASYVCHANGQIKRSEQTSSSGQQHAPAARPLVPRKPAHLQAAVAVPSQSSGAGNSQFESIRGSCAPDPDEQKRADSSNSRQREQECAAAVAVAATSIAAALHQSSQQQQQQQFEAAAKQANASAAAVAADEETKASGQQQPDSTLVEVDEVASGATYSQSNEPDGRQSTTPNDRTQAPVDDDDDLLGQPQSLIELSTVSEVSNESLAGELSAGLVSSSSGQKQQPECPAGAEPGLAEQQQQQQNTTGEEKRERFLKHRSESLERATGATGSSTSISSSSAAAKVSQAPAKRRRSSSSGERGQTQMTAGAGGQVVAKVANYAAAPLCGSSARSSPVDCPYPHDIIQALPSPPVSFAHSHSTSTASVATPTTGSTTVPAASTASVCLQGEKLPAVGSDEPSRASSLSTCSVVASSAAANSIQPAAQLCKRLSHDDTMEAIEDDVEGEEQEMRLEQEELRSSCSQTPEPSLAPPAGFTGGPESTAGSCHSTQLARRPSSSLGGQSIKEEEEEEDGDFEGPSAIQKDGDQKRDSLPHDDDDDEADENDEDEESSISVSQNRGVVVTQEVLGRSRPSTQQSLETTGSSIQMKRFKKSSSNSSPGSNSSSSAAHATPVSSPTSTPSKSSQSTSSSSNATRTADPSDKSQCEPLVDESRELASPIDATCDEPRPPPQPVQVEHPLVDRTKTSGQPMDKTGQEPGVDAIEQQKLSASQESEEEASRIPNEFATHAILEHLSRRNPSLAAVAQLAEEPPQSLELCRSIDPQQRRASWRRESETSRLGSSSSSAATIATSTIAPQKPEQASQQASRDDVREVGAEFAPTSTMKRRQKSQPTETTSCDTGEPLAVETIPMQIDDSLHHTQASVSSENMEIRPEAPAGRACEATAGSAAQEERQESPPAAGSKRRPPLKQLKSPNQQPQQQSLNSFDRTDADASICSSCSCMEASFDQGAQPTGPCKQVAVLSHPHRPVPAPAPAATAGGETKPGPSSAWMSQEEGTVFTENYWLSHWLYISEHEEAEIWRRAIDMTSSGGGGTGSGQIRNQAEVGAEPLPESATKIAGMPACMSETASTISERGFNSRYKSTTRKMIHRRASIEMYKRIMSNSLRREKRIEISRSSVGEFGFRIHGSRPVVVSAIERGTSAETCGLQVGDVIYAINDTNILDMAHSDVVRLAHQADASSALVLDLIPTNSFLQQQLVSSSSSPSPGQPQASKRYEPTVTGHLMRLSASTAQPLLVQLQEQIAAEGGLANAKERAAKLNKVMRRAWRPRYFVLRADNCLYWYKSARDTIEPHGGLNLQGFSATLTDEFSEPTYVIRLVKYGGQPHYLGSNNLCDVQTWVDAINRAATEANQCDPYMKRTLVLARSKPNEIQAPDCSGWLYKFSHKRGGGAHWRAAYFVLKDACLYLFRSQRAELVEQASAVYYLHGYRVRSKHIEHKRHTFELVPPNRKTIKPMFLMASNEIDKKRWIAALEYSIERWIEIN